MSAFPWLVLTLACLGTFLYLFIIGFAPIFLLGGKKHVFFSVFLSPAVAVSVLAAWAIASHYLKIPWNRENLLALGAVFAVAIIARLIFEVVNEKRHKQNRHKVSQHTFADSSTDSKKVRGSSDIAIEGKAKSKSVWNTGPLENNNGEINAKVTALLLAIVGIGFGLLYFSQFERPDLFSQTYDAVFHLNQTQWFISRQDGSSFHTNILGTNQMKGFYPSAWHDVTSAIAMLFGLKVPLATNVVSWWVMGIVWPFSNAAFAYVIGSDKRTKLVSFVLVASYAFVAFPYLIAYWGVLYPTVLSYSLAPALLALIYTFAQTRRIRTALLALGGILLLFVGVALAQTATVFLVAVLSLPAFYMFIRHILCDIKFPRWLAAIFAFGLTVALVLGLDNLSMRIPTIKHLRTAFVGWDPPYESFGDSLWYTLMGVVPMLMWTQALIYSISVQILCLLGCVWLVKHRRGTIVVAYFTVIMMAATLFSITGPWREYLFGFWYTDNNRLVSAIPIAAVQTLSAGMLLVYEWFSKQIKIVGKSKLLFKYPELTVSIVALGLYMGSAPVTAVMHQLSMIYDLDEDPIVSEELVSKDEFELLNRLEREVPKQDTILGNPWYGTALAQPYSGRKVLFPHLADSNNPDAIYLARNLNRAKVDPKVCPLVRKYQAYYVLDFSGNVLWGGRDKEHRQMNYPGLNNLVPLDLATVVDQEGEARLLKLTVCQP
ncbi:hypothetical protein BK816_03345 [Boudabousia tangfeifanii]|uniref:Uncharacterized protein n=1 Tax=Boudabousia tangfeifanii TaxID=1912795 RepID=A0A1D9MJG2_9ACTO|nr:DUF6541 family protein [Boudabousia tangfeifanii]AOZ72445.1 hypothetical protein BK816_03345 [Boudabousia tangfeifanii]